MTLHLILMLNTMNILMRKDLNLKLVIMSEYQNTKIIFAKGYTQNWSKEVSVVSKTKDTVQWTYVINVQPTAGNFCEKEL